MERQCAQIMHFKKVQSWKFYSASHWYIYYHNWSYSHTTLPIHFINTQVILCPAINYTFTCYLMSSQHILQPVQIDHWLLETKRKKRIHLLLTIHYKSTYFCNCTIIGAQLLAFICFFIFLVIWRKKILICVITLLNLADVLLNEKTSHKGLYIVWLHLYEIH